MTSKIPRQHNNNMHKRNNKVIPIFCNTYAVRHFM